MSSPTLSTADTVLDDLTFRQVLRLPTMRRLWYAQIVSVFGDFLALFAVITYMTFKLHATAQQITGVQIAYLLPLAILGIVSGVFVDRWPVKVTLVSSDYIRAALVLLLLAVHSILGFYLVLAAISVVSSFFGPAQGISIRAAVPFHGIRAANGLMQQVYFVMRIVGPSTAALMVHRFGAHACFVIDTATFLASGTLIASLTLILPTSPSPTPLSSRPESSLPPGSPPSVVGSSGWQSEDAVERPASLAPPNLSGLSRILADMREATRFILHHSALLFVIFALCAGMFVLGCAGPLVAIYVRDILHATGSTFAFTFAMIGFGLIVGVNGLNAFGKRLRSTTQVYCGLLGIALGTLILAALPFVVATVCGCFVIGISAAGILVPANIIIQQETPVELLGRVGSTGNSAIFTAQVAGLILTGVLTEHTSIRIVFALSTILLLSLVLAGKLWMDPTHSPASA
jgi:DHA3 family macrolide efflux protein-like MFS transporter